MPSLLASVAAEAGSASSESRRLRTGSSATAAAWGSSMTSTANIDMAIESLTSFIVKRFYGLFAILAKLLPEPGLDIRLREIAPREQQRHPRNRSDRIAHAVAEIEPRGMSPP